MREILRAALIVAALGATGLTAQAQPIDGGADPTVPVDDPRARATRAPDWLFVHASSGVGGMSTTGFGCTLPPCSEIVASGIASTFSLEVGGLVFGAVGLGVQAWGGYAPGAAPWGGAVTLVGAGPNLTLRSRERFYVSGSPSVSSLSFGGDAYTGRSVRVAAGKEWAVRGRWGLGLNLEYIHGSHRRDDPFPLTTKTFAIGLSATHH